VNDCRSSNRAETETVQRPAAPIAKSKLRHRWLNVKWCETRSYRLSRSAVARDGDIYRLRKESGSLPGHRNSTVCVGSELDVFVVPNPLPIRCALNREYPPGRRVYQLGKSIVSGSIQRQCPSAVAEAASVGLPTMSE